jgi:hypothetical protein
VVIYETVTLPIVLYGCKAWTVNQGSLDKLEAFNNAACRRINNRNLWHMREYGITSASLLKRVGIQTMTNYLARLQLSWLGHVARMPPSRTPKQLLTAEVTSRKRLPFLTYGGSITNMMKRIAYAFPLQSSYSSLNPGAAVYMSPAHADSHNQQRDEIKPSTPEKEKDPHDSSHTHTSTPTQPTLTARPHSTPTTVTEAAKFPQGARLSHSKKDSASTKDKVETVTTGRGKRATKLVQRGIQYNASSPLSPISIATSTGQDTELEAQKAKFEKAIATRARKQDAAKNESSCSPKQSARDH